MTTDQELEAALDFPQIAQHMIDIVRKSHGALATIANLQRERLRHQDRANAEAIEADRLRVELSAALKRGDEAYEMLQDSLDLIDRLKLIVHVIKHHVENCPDGVGRFLAERIAEIETMPPATTQPEAIKP